MFALMTLVNGFLAPALNSFSISNARITNGPRTAYSIVLISGFILATVKILLVEFRFAAGECKWATWAWATAWAWAWAQFAAVVCKWAGAGAPMRAASLANEIVAMGSLKYRTPAPFTVNNVRGHIPINY